MKFHFGCCNTKSRFIVLILIIVALIIYFAISAILNQDVISENDWKNGRMDLNKANQLYRSCCQEVNLEAGCLEACRYDLTLKTARHVFFENQDRNMCDLNESIERFVRCANGIHKPKDIRPCCLKMGATTTEGDACDIYCDPTKFAGIGQIKRPAKCALTFRRMLYCHFVNLEE